MSATELPDLPAGVWRHHNGPLYQVLGYAEDSTNAAEPGRVVVVYVGLQLDGQARSLRLKVREAGEFLGWAHLDDGSACSDPGLRGYKTWEPHWPLTCIHGRPSQQRFIYEGVGVPA
jgi:hypothetical protein